MSTLFEGWQRAGIKFRCHPPFAEQGHRILVTSAMMIARPNPLEKV